jgi:hypothetical protein
MCNQLESPTYVIGMKVRSSEKGVLKLEEVLRGRNCFRKLREGAANIFMHAWSPLRCYSSSLLSLLQKQRLARYFGDGFRHRL